MRICALTSNPALDLSGHVSRVILNEKNYVISARHDPGGNAINAARVASRLSADVVALGFLGGEVGDQIKKLLKREKIRQNFTAIAEDTRINVTVTNDSDHKQTRLTFPGPRVTAHEIKKLCCTTSNLRAPGIFVLGGSLPTGCKPTLYSVLIRDAQSQKLGVVADLPALYLKKVLHNRGPKLLFVKPNQVELERLFRENLQTTHQIKRAALKLTSRAAGAATAESEGTQLGNAVAIHRLVGKVKIHAL